MNILFLSDNFPPEVNAPATRTFEHCRRWVREGHDVTVITCAPNFPRGELFEGYRNRLKKEERMEGVRIIRVWTYITANEGFLRRTADYFSFAVSSFLAGLFRKPDVIVATSPQFFTTWSAWLLSKLKRTPWVFELRDLWPDTIEAVGAIRSGAVLRLLEAIELFLYRSADLVVAVTERFKRNLVERGIPEGKIRVVTNGADLEMFRPRSKNRRLEEELGLAGNFVVGYVGTMGLTHGLDFILDAVKGLDPAYHFLFLGEGAEKEKLRAQAERLELTNVTFLDPVPKHEVAEYISLFDAALVPLKDREVFRTVIPSKIFEQAAMRKPILLGVDGQAREIVEDHHAGLFYRPEDRQDFLSKLRTLKENPRTYRALAEGCADLAEAYDRERKAGEMLGCLEETARP